LLSFGRIIPDRGANNEDNGDNKDEFGLDLILDGLERIMDMAWCQ
jgi:hypothetical protein